VARKGGRPKKAATAAETIVNAGGAARLRELLDQHGLTASEANRRLGKNPSDGTLYRVRAGRMAIGPKLAVQYGKLFGVSPEEFMGGPIIRAVNGPVAPVERPMQRFSSDLMPDGKIRLRIDMAVPMETAMRLMQELKAYVVQPQPEEGE